MQTMFVSVPEIIETNVNYEFTVKPKISAVFGEGGNEIEPEEEIKKEILEEKKEEIKENSLPNTGTITWQIPFLAGVGITLFCISWLFFYIKKKEK